VELQPKMPSTHGPADMFIGDVWFDVIAAGAPPSQPRSPSPSWSRSAAASRRSRATWPGNLRVGNDRARLIDVLSQLLPFIGYPRTLNGLRVVDEVTAP
jgi:hypothetical protein